MVDALLVHPPCSVNTKSLNSGSWSHRMTMPSPDTYWVANRLSSYYETLRPSRVRFLAENDQHIVEMRSD